MGGSIFNKEGIQARRIDSEEFNDISFEICANVLGSIFKKCNVVKSYQKKISHGDVDFLVSEPRDTYNNWKEQIINHYYIKQFSTHSASNGDEVSILFRGVQCDFRIIKPSFWDSSVFFCNYDPSSNALGRIARWLGVRFGYRGLVYPVYTENRQAKLDEIIISSNSVSICEFFGLNYNDNFVEKEDIFNYIVSNKFYGIDCFKEENWDNATRTRNRKRKVFCEFIEWVHKYHDYNKIDFLTKDNVNEYIPMFEKFFSINLTDQINSSREKFKLNKELSNKFNGKTVMDLTGLTGKELGNVLGRYKKSKEIWVDTWHNFLLNNSAEEIKKDFLQFYAK